MRIVNIPPYQKEGVNYSPTEGHFMMTELIGQLRAKGQLDGVEIDVDPGEPTTQSEEVRDAEVLANIAAGVVRRVKAVCAMGKYDAIVTQAGIEPGFEAARTVSTLPIVFPLHAALHMASMIGDRCCVLAPTDAQSMIVRRNAVAYGFGAKLTSVRHVSRSSTWTLALVRRVKKADRAKDPDVQGFVDAVVTQFREAIEREHVDTVIVAGPHQQCFHDEIRQGLDAAGYGEIVLISAYAAAVEMAKAMVSMKISQAPRAYPSDRLKAKPAYR